MMSLFKRLEAGFTVLALLQYSSVLAMPLGGELSEADPTYAQGEVDGSSSVLLLMQLMTLIILLVLVGLRWKRTLVAAVMVPMCWMLPALAILSTGWSEVPDITLRRGILLAGATLLGIYWAVRYPLTAYLRQLAWSLGIAALLCFIFALVFPNFGIEHGDHSGAWRGLFSQKNVLARAMVLGAITCLCLVLDRERRRLLWWGGLLLTAALLILSTSKTGLLIMLVLVACIPFFRALRGKPLHVILGLMLGVLSLSCLALVLMNNAELILTALGRDVTLTGRTGIWDVVLSKITQRPWFGYGYKSFWLGMEGESADIWYTTFFIAAHAHNGYLDLALDLGLIGLGIFMISCGFTVVQAIAWLRQHPHSMAGVFPLLYLTYLLLYNITESSLILEPNNLFWLLYVYVATSIKTQAVNLETSTDLTVHSRLREARHA